MKRIVIFFVCAVMVSFASAQNLSVPEFETAMNSNARKIVLDVRTPDEFKSGHLPEAVIIDYYSNTFRQQLAKLDTSKPVFVYCKAGVRSASAAEILKELGFNKIYQLNGGIDSWRKAGKKIVK
jgi:rhodanese-related sulfurtransferase